jgi:hypothetical protein
VLKERVRKNRHLAFRVRSKKLKEDKHLLSPSFLRVSKQIYQEALTLLYKQHLEFVNLSALFYFLSQIGKDAVQSVQDITIDFITLRKRSDITHPAFTVLVNAINLDSLHIRDMCSQPCYWYFEDIQVGTVARWFFPVAHVWIEQMERNKGNGKDWRKVLSFARDEKERSCYEGPLPHPCEEVFKDIEKLLNQ